VGIDRLPVTDFARVSILVFDRAVHKDGPPPLVDLDEMINDVKGGGFVFDGHTGDAHRGRYRLVD